MSHGLRRAAAAVRRRLHGLRNDRFLRRLTLLSSGVLAGQTVAVLLSPLLTRLYTPAEFGVLGVLMALAGLLAGSIALRYEAAIPVADDEGEAVALTALAILVALLLSALLAVAVWALGERLAAWTGAPDLMGVLWLLPITTASWGVSMALAFWSVRRGTFRLNAIGKALQLSSQAVAQAALGLTMGGSLGLALGQTFGYVLRCAHFLQAMPGGERARLCGTGLAMLWRTARRHWRYPVFSCPSALLQSGTQFLPAMLMAILYGPAVAGWFTFGQRLLELPVGLLSVSAGSVYLGELRSRDADGIRRLFARTVRRFLVIGLLGMLPLLLLGPQLFALVFGEPWRMAGVMVQCLVPVQLARFVVLPVVQTLNLFGRQELHLLSALLNLAALGLSFTLGWWQALSPLVTLLLFSLGSALAYLVYLGAAWRVILHTAAMPGPGAGPTLPDPS